MNSYLKYFLPKPNGDSSPPLPQEELVDILGRAAPIEWHIDMMKANMDLVGLSWDSAVDYFERLELTSALEKRACSQPSSKKGKKRKQRENDNDSTSSSKKPKATKGKWCEHCKRDSHNTANC